MSRSVWIVLSSLACLACSNPCHELEAAAMVGDVAAMERSVSAGTDASCHGDDAWQPIHYAARSGHLAAMTWLLDHGVDIESLGEIGRRPLYEAAKYDHPSAVRLLLERGADVNGASSLQMTPLYVVSERRFQDVAQILIDAGANVNAANNIGVTPLAQLLSYAPPAADGDATAFARLLIAHGAWLDVHSRDGWTPLHIACSTGLVQAATLLIDSGANPSPFATGRHLPGGYAGRHETEIRALIDAHTLWSPNEIAHPAMPPSSITRGGVVIGASGPRAAPRGTRCEVTMRPFDDQTHQHFTCQVVAACDGAGLYGGAQSGLAVCEEIDGHWRGLDAMMTPEDGDPSMILDFGRHAFVVDDGLMAPNGTSIQLRLDD